MNDPYVAVARFVPRMEAWPLAGRLEAEGIDAQVIRQQESLAGYEPFGGGGLSTYMVIVPERDAGRARWILDGIRGAE